MRTLRASAELGYPVNRVLIGDRPQLMDDTGIVGGPKARLPALGNCFLTGRGKPLGEREAPDRRGVEPGAAQQREPVQSVLRHRLLMRHHLTGAVEIEPESTEQTGHHPAMSPFVVECHPIDVKARHFVL